MADKVSIQDIAHIAGVSVATVSNVLNHKGRYSEKTRRLVEKVAKSEGYVPNLAARGLREARTHTVGIVTPDVSNDFFSTIVLDLEMTLRAHGYTSLICNTLNVPGYRADCLRTFRERQVDGVVLVGGGDLSAGELGWDVPVVCVDCEAGEDVPRAVSVNNDLRRMFHNATSVLVARGCERVGLLFVSAEASFDDGNPRFVGYSEALAAASLDLDRDLLLAGPHRQRSYVEAGQLVDACLDAGHAFDGLVCAGDRVAMGATEALRERGVRLGSDVRVIGMDNSLYSRVVTPPISSVDRGTSELAHQATDALLALMGDKELPERRIVVPHRIVERTTTLGV